MGAPQTILVVEDNDFVRMQIVSFLKEAGYGTVEVSDGSKAIDAMNKDISLAVVDVRMEPIGGFSFIGMMKSQGYDIPVMLVTGDDSVDLLTKAAEHGVGTVLLKPVQKDRLLSSVSRLLGRRAAK